MKITSYLRVDSSRQLFCKMIKWHRLKMSWLTNDQTSLDLGIKRSFRGGKNKSCFRHFDINSRKGVNARWDTISRNAGPTLVNSAASAKNIATCSAKKIEKLQQIVWNGKEGNTSIQKYVLLFDLLYPAKSRIPRARSRKWSAVSEKPAKESERSAKTLWALWLKCCKKLQLARRAE